MLKAFRLTCFLGISLGVASIPAYASRGFNFHCKFAWAYLTPTGYRLDAGAARENYRVLRKALSTFPYIKRQLYGTTIYYTPPSAQRLIVPELAKDTQGIVLAFSGAGGSGSAAAFMPIAASLARYQIALISFAYPFHESGPTERDFYNLQVFMGQVRLIIGRLALAGLPILFLGHSFGNPLIQEVLYQDSLTETAPLAKGVYMVSPGGVTSGLWDHYVAFRNDPIAWPAFVQKYKFVPNEPGENWQQIIVKQFRSNKCDISFIDTPVPVTIFVPSHDDFCPLDISQTQLRYRFRSTKFVEVDGQNHHSIFRSRERNERWLTRRILEFFDPTGTKLVRKEVPITDVTRVAFLDQQVPAFHEWLLSKPYSPLMRIVEKGCHTILADFQRDSRIRYVINAVGELYPVELSGHFLRLARDGSTLDYDKLPIVFNGTPLEQLTVQERMRVGKYFTEIFRILSKDYSNITDNEFDKLVSFMMSCVIEIRPRGESPGTGVEFTRYGSYHIEVEGFEY